MSDLGELIKEKRAEKHLTMEQLGKLCGVQKAAVSKWENGRVNTMKVSTATRLCKVLDIPQEVILNYVMEDKEVSEEEMKKDMLWRSFSLLNEENQRAVFIMINALAAQQSK